MEKTSTASETANWIEDSIEHTNKSVARASWKDYVAITKTGIVISNLITVFVGLFLAAYYTGTSLIQEPLTAIAALLGSTLILAGGCSLNNYIDRDIDPIMDRTQDRPTVSGTLLPDQVLKFGLSISIAGTTLLALASLSAALIGVVGLVVYVVLYSMWTKRTTTLNTIVGSFAGAAPPLIGWAAIDPSLHPLAWSLFLLMFVWQPPHFLALAMKRSDEYKAAGIPMLPVVAGFAVTKRQIVLYTATIIPVSLLLVPFGTVYMLVALVMGGGWLALGLAGYKMNDDIKWARLMFVYSLNYFMILFIVMIIVHMF
ncbi:heme o synthase [Texcoconibacillus texcoconensis]|uniref:Protoheme IX farnesyltransferase n=1 Tax=Texcoconibacillus texcoconensis TaxID=1095777 RepID=A0A840QLH3_9BACI|nr:protoheme IX farnesyltransferase [Texcoconibacillus texcoconensis]